MNELLSYVFSPLREGNIALYRGSGNGLASILLVAAAETSLGCVERLEHEYALKGELDADWAARPWAACLKRARNGSRLTIYIRKLVVDIVSMKQVPVLIVGGGPVGMTLSPARN